MKGGQNQGRSRSSLAGIAAACLVDDPEERGRRRADSPDEILDARLQVALLKGEGGERDNGVEWRPKLRIEEEDDGGMRPQCEGG